MIDDLGQLFRVFIGVLFVLINFIIIFSIAYIFILILSVLLSEFNLSFLIKNSIYYNKIAIDYFIYTTLALLLSKELLFLSKILEKVYQNFIFRTLELYFLHYDNIYFNRKWFNFINYSPRNFKNKQLKYKSNSVDFFLRKIFNFDFQHYEYKRRVYGLLKGRKIRRTISIKRYFFDTFGGNMKVESNIRVANRVLAETLKKKKDRKGILEMYIGYFQQKRPFMIKIAGDWFTSPQTMTIDKQLAWYYLSMVGTTPFKLLVNSLLFYDVPFIMRLCFLIFILIIFVVKVFFSFFILSLTILFKFCDFFFLYNFICIKTLMGYGIYIIMDIIIFIFFLNFMGWIYRDGWLYFFKNWLFLKNSQINLVLITSVKQTFIFLCSYAFDKIKTVDFNNILQTNIKKHYLFSNLFQNYKYYKKFKNKRDLTYKEIVGSPWRRLNIRQRRKRGLRYMEYFKNINNILNRLTKLNYFKYNKGNTRTPSWRRQSFLRVGFERIFQNRNFRNFLEPFLFSKIIQNYLRTNYLYSLQYRIGMNFFYFKELDLKLKIDPLNLFYFFSLIEFMFKKDFLVAPSRSTSIVSVTFYFEAIYRLYFVYISFLYNIQVANFIKPTAFLYEKLPNEPFSPIGRVNEEFFDNKLKHMIQLNLLENNGMFNKLEKNYIFFLLVDFFLSDGLVIKNSVSIKYIMPFLAYCIQKYKE